jgi:hypothetical protein
VPYRMLCFECFGVSKVDCLSIWMFHVFVHCVRLSLIWVSIHYPVFECPLYIANSLNVECVSKCVHLSLRNMWTSMVYARVRLHIHIIFMRHWVYMYLNVCIFESFFMFLKNHLEMNKASFHVSLKGFST